MFKRVKTLLVSGLLVMGMAVPAFADSVPSYDLSCLLPHNGTHDGEVHYIEDEDGVTTDNFLQNVVKPIEDNIRDGLIISKEDPGSDTNYDAKWVIYKDKNFDNDKTEFDGDCVLETIYIDYADDTHQQKGWLPEITPGTGDAIALGGLAVAAVAAGGLTIVNKKRNK